MMKGKKTLFDTDERNMVCVAHTHTHPLTLFSSDSIASVTLSIDVSKCDDDTTPSILARNGRTASSTFILVDTVNTRARESVRTSVDKLNLYCRNVNESMG